MSDCSFNQQISAYHDGELDSSRREEVERHLLQCPACSAELTELRKMSNLFVERAAPQPKLSQISLYRLHQQTQKVMEDGLVRIARAISAIAACVLVASSAWLMHTNQMAAPVKPVEASVGVPPWVDVTVAANRDSAAVDTTTPAAAWYLASARVDDTP
jgi:anti-sigma factor RsiW